MSELWRRLRYLFRRGQFDRDLEEEMRFHLEMKAQQNREAGMDANEARHAARRKFGNVTALEEHSRDAWGWRWLEDLTRDVRYAARSLRHSPGFTAVAILSLALGIGANVTIFSLFNALMLRMLPVSHPEQLVSIHNTGGWGYGHTSYPVYLALRERKDLFEGVLARSGIWSVRLGTDRAELVGREFVSGEYFQLLGIRPALGRLIGPEDTRAIGGERVVVLDYDFWRSRFGGDASIIGRTIRVDSQRVTVIGVAQPVFHGVETEMRPQIWAPLTLSHGNIMDPGMSWLQLLARPLRGVGTRQLQSALDAFFAHHLASRYGGKPESEWRRRGLSQRLLVGSGGIGISSTRERFGKPLEILLAAVAMVLLIACANVAGLMLARGAARRREIALRFSLGASRARVLRQLVAESLLLAAAGGAAGLAFAFWGRQGLLHFFPGLTQPDVSLDRTVLAFAAAISLASVVVIGILPAFRATAIDTAPSLKEGAAGARNRARPTLRKCFVVAQVALSVVLVMTGGLFARSLAHLRATDPGFHELGVFTFSIDFPGTYKEKDAAAFSQRYLERIGAMPGILSTSYGFPGPYQGGGWSAGIRIPGSEKTAREPAMVEMQLAAPRYFETIGSALVRGREFDARDSASAPKVAVVNEAFARKFFDGANPIGRVFSMDDEKPEGGERTTFIGLARDMLHKDMRAKAVPNIYVPPAQVPNPSLPKLLVRTTLPAESLVPLLRRELAAMDRSLALIEFGSIRQQIDNSIYLDRLLAVVSGFFGMLSLLLAGIGLYGVMAYAVTRRTSEIGIRMAMGADRPRVLWMVLREGLALIAIGLLLGVPLSLAATRLAGSLLFEIGAQDPATLALTAVVLLATGAIAALLPARRATHISPIEALRYE